MPTSREELLLQLDNSRDAVSLAMSTIHKMKNNQTVDTGWVRLRLAMILQAIEDFFKVQKTNWGRNLLLSGWLIWNVVWLYCSLYAVGIIR
jgi:hypothetical protein